jgi:adenylylsulfate kinase-like enzyme
LLELKPTETGDASGRTECMSATRSDILGQIRDWAKNISDTQNVFWLYGVAGSGKSTISTTLASYFRNQGRLGAFLFFDRSFPEKSHPSKVIRTLAYKLGLFNRRIGTAISAVIEQYSTITDSSLHIQFAELLVKPLSSSVNR